MIDDWLPESWPSEVIEAMGRFTQGDLIEQPPVSFSAKSAFGITALVREQGDPAEGDELFDLLPESGPPYGMITTETCDLVEDEADSPRQPFISVAPVYDFGPRVDENRASLIREGRISYLHPLGESYALETGLWAADLRIEVPLEKSMLVGRFPIGSPIGDSDRVTLASVLAARRDRPVLPATVHRGVVRPLRRWVERMKPDKRAEVIADCEVRLIIAGDRSNPDGVGLMVVTDGSEISPVGRELWLARFVHMKKAAEEAGLTLVETEFVSLDTVPARRYLESCRVDLRFN